MFRLQGNACRDYRENLLGLWGNPCWDYRDFAVQGLQDFRIFTSKSLIFWYITIKIWQDFMWSRLAEWSKASVSHARSWGFESRSRQNFFFTFFFKNRLQIPVQRTGKPLYRLQGNPLGITGKLCADYRETLVRNTGNLYMDYRENPVGVTGNPCRDYRETPIVIKGKIFEDYRETPVGITRNPCK